MTYFTFKILYIYFRLKDNFQQTSLIKKVVIVTPLIY